MYVSIKFDKENMMSPFPPLESTIRFVFSVFERTSELDLLLGSKRLRDSKRQLQSLVYEDLLKDTDVVFRSTQTFFLSLSNGC